MAPERRTEPYNRTVRLRQVRLLQREGMQVPGEADFVRNQ